MAGFSDSNRSALNGAKESKSDRDARQRLLELERRISDNRPDLPEHFYQFQLKIHQRLEQACNSGHLLNRFRDLTKPLYEYTTPESNKGIGFVDGGSRVDRWVNTNQFRRDDGACFNFFVMVRYLPTYPPELIAYHFNIAFPDGRAPAFVRFDLNEAEYAKPEERDALQSPLLCHAHPGRKHMIIPTPIMAPWEILDILLYAHLRRPFRSPAKRSTVSPDRKGVRWKYLVSRSRSLLR